VQLAALLRIRTRLIFEIFDESITGRDGGLKLQVRVKGNSVTIQ
jgi:hypothetical protein